MASPIVELTKAPIDYHHLIERIRSPQAGAVLLFLGTVREFTSGRQTLRLGYEAYPQMALTKMRELAKEACQRWPVVEVAIVHRLGVLELGDISVAIAVSTPHRDQGFEAGRWLIDTLKEVVPVWKQENWSDGSQEWVHPGVSTPSLGSSTPPIS